MYSIVTAVKKFKSLYIFKVIKFIRPLSYYAFSQEWLLPSLPIGCLTLIILFLTYFFLKDLG